MSDVRGVAQQLPPRKEVSAVAEREVQIAAKTEAPQDEYVDELLVEELPPFELALMQGCPDIWGV